MLNGTIQNSEPAAAKVWQRDGDRFYRVEQNFDVPLSTKSIRVAVRDVHSDHIGALEVSLPLAPEPDPSAVLASPDSIPKPN
jgi:hypothetical protein